MTRRLRTSARLATAAVLTAAALATAGAGEALAAPQFQTLTVGNGGKNLAVQNGAAVAVKANPQATPTQQFELLFPGSAGSSEPGFGSAFQLKNRTSGKCLRDIGNGSQLVEQTCFANPSVNSAQLWQQHIQPDREVNGKRFFHLFNRKTDRVLSQAPQFGNAVPVLSLAGRRPTPAAPPRRCSCGTSPGSTDPAIPSATPTDSRPAGKAEKSVVVPDVVGARPADDRPTREAHSGLLTERQF